MKDSFLPEPELGHAFDITSKAGPGTARTSRRIMNITLTKQEIGPFILCFVENLRLKQIVGDLQFHRIIFLAVKRNNIYLKIDRKTRVKFDFDFQKKVYGPYSPILENYIISLITYGLLAKDVVWIDSETQQVTYFATKRGIELFKKELTSKKQSDISWLTRTVNIYNEVSQQEVFEFIEKINTIDCVWTIMFCLIKLTIKLAHLPYYYVYYIKPRLNKQGYIHKKK